MYFNNLQYALLFKIYYNLVLSFPSKPERKKQWVKNIRRDGWLPNNSSVICSDHFKESNIDRTGQLNVRLKPDAVPTRFKKFPQHLKKVNIN